MKKIGAFFFILLFLLFSAASSLFLELDIYVTKPAGHDYIKKKMTVHTGQAFHTTLEKLHEMNIVKNRFKFKMIAVFRGYDKRIKAGEYLLSGAMAPSEIFKVLVRGKVQLYRLTVPEGYNLYQIATLVADSGWGTKNAFLKIAKDASWAKRAGIEADTLEGYLFPDTYYFQKGATAEQMISTMIKQFWSVFSPAWTQQASKLGLSVHEIVTLASIIEKETGTPFERPIISSVFHNRMKKGMRFESDPTVIYGLKEFDGNLTRKHLATFTPYNTYQVKGLPPGPIANPGRKALEAALYPADTDYLFFVSKRDRTHRFSTNLKDHIRAVKKYQLRKRK
ncbi:MAG: endolytic transglycosylase MltG [Desulfobacterales bacterium]